MSYSLCCSYTVRTLDNGNRAKCAMLLFAEYIDADTSMSESCGGGSTPSSSWGKKDDEDERKFANRCAQMAHSMCKPKPRAEVFTDKSMKYGNQKKQDKHRHRRKIRLRQHDA